MLMLQNYTIDIAYIWIFSDIYRYNYIEGFIMFHL